MGAWPGGGLYVCALPQYFVESSKITPVSYFLLCFQVSALTPGIQRLHVGGRGKVLDPLLER